MFGVLGSDFAEEWCLILGRGCCFGEEDVGEEVKGRPFGDRAGQGTWRDL